MLKASHIEKGRQAEMLSIDYLQKQGLKLLTKNFSCRFGEIDAIMFDKKDLVFIEVRYRNNTKFGGAIASIDTTKQNKIRNTAEYYLQQHPDIDFQQCRFDVVAVNNLTSEQPEWIKNAF